MVRAALDHLVVAAATLEQGEDYVESRIGVRPQRGGKHVAMGTHNSVLRIGQGVYLEVIAIDPLGIAPKHPRWFELDRSVMRTALRVSPRLIHWVARCTDVDAVGRACPVDPGPVYPMSRGEFRWRITIPDDGRLPGAGILPTLIEWADAHHPTDTMPDAGVRLMALAAAHPEPAAMRAALAALGLGETLQISFAATPRLAAMLRTPRGPASL